MTTDDRPHRSAAESQPKGSLLHASHRQIRRALAGDTGIYVLVHSAGILEAALCVPLLAHLLPSASLALLGAVEGAMILILSLSQLGVKFSYLQLAPARDEYARGDLLGTCILLVAIAGLVVAFIGAIAINLLSGNLMAGVDSPVSAAALCWTASASNIYVMLVTQLRSIRRSTVLIAINYAQALCNVCGIWLLCGWFALAVDGVFYARAFAVSVAGLCLASIILPRQPLQVVPGLVWPLLRYGIPMMIGGLIRYTFDAMFRWLLLGLGMTNAAAAYALIARAAATFDSVFATPALMAWGGIVYPLFARADLHSTIRLLLRDYVIAGTLAALAVTACAAWLLPLGRAPFEEAHLLGMWPIAVAGKLLFCLQLPFAAGYLARRQSGWSVRYNALGLVLFLAVVPASLALAGPVAGLAAWISADATALGLLGWRGSKMLASGGQPAQSLLNR